MDPHSSAIPPQPAGVSAPVDGERPVVDPLVSTIRRRDLVAGLVAIGVIALLLAGALGGAPLLPSSAEGSVGFYSRQSVATSTGDELSFIAPQGWFVVDEGSTDSADAASDGSTEANGEQSGQDESDDQGDTVPTTRRFESPNGGTSLVVSGDDLPETPDTVFTTRSCHTSSNGSGESCIEVQLIVTDGATGGETDSDTAAARAVATSVGVVS